MAILCECPSCKRRNSLKAKNCKCGFALAKYSGKCYWISYYDLDKKLCRERVGPNKQAAEQRLRQVLSDRTEGRHVHKSPDARVKFVELARWYLNLPEVKAKQSFKRDKGLLANLLLHFGDMLLKDIKPNTVESFKLKRLAEPSGRTPGTFTAPATVNRELACLKSVFNKAIANDKAEKSPFQGRKVKMLKENNERTRILTHDEYIRLLAHCSPKVKPIVKVAYFTAMRQAEILNLIWQQLDLREGFIHLQPKDTKTNEARSIPLNAELIEMFGAMPRGFPGVRVFPYKGKAFGSTFQKAFNAAKQAAGINDFVFHDLRHTAINNWRLQGHDYFRIMAASGHKTLSVFKRYNTVTKDELKALVKG